MGGESFLALIIPSFLSRTQEPGKRFANQKGMLNRRLKTEVKSFIEKCYRVHQKCRRRLLSQQFNLRRPSVHRHLSNILAKVTGVILCRLQDCPPPPGAQIKYELTQRPPTRAFQIFRFQANYSFVPNSRSPASPRPGKM